MRNLCLCILFVGLTVATADAQTPEVRRVVTALDSNGKAVALFDGKVALKSLRSPNPAGEMWVTTDSPAAYTEKDDWAQTKVGISPPPRGTIFRIVEFPPTNERVHALDVNTMMRAVGDHAPKKGLPPRHSMMHRTKTLDYTVIMSGEIDMLLDEGEVHFSAGDVLVQQATNHAWINRGTQPCRIAFILMDAREP
ncbi:MAG: cupin domain-containing protein [Rhodoplanes sp.]|uniref:cupin domain-containing protein n=1 Tax=Rhodoplanes sp. TaxID=1968906 RepID=UPI001845E5E8|nr:cupin domain-containing protein [Rhodoplanes sp.]NVO17900.1 cupin domain-containing protein [Rhodoplanes sp.]